MGLGRCPVCGDGVGSAPRACPRCRTPHHPECWEYVPGCAIFACADTAASIGSEEWSSAQRLVMLRTSILGWGSRLILAGIVICFVLLAFGYQLFQPVFRLPIGLVVLGMACPMADLVIQARLARIGGLEELTRLQADGDRHLRGAIRARCSLPMKAPAWEIAASLALLQLAAVNLGFVHTWDVSGAMLFDGILHRNMMVLAGACGLFVYWPLAWLASAMVGSQQVLANRFEASHRIEKPGPEGPAPDGEPP